MIMNLGSRTIVTVLLFPFLFSCASVRKATYFDITQDSIAGVQYPKTESPIQKNDLLSITVTSLSPEASEIFNMPNVVAGAGTTATPGGYLVNEDGNIQFPVIGSIQAAGFTKQKLSEEIIKLLTDRKLLLNPIVSIRNLNYKVTVLGEVANPTVISVPNEKINLLEAVGFAGDLTLFSNRSNVLLIREENNQRVFKILNLNSNDIFSSPYFYLKPNDIIYVKPNKTKISSASTSRQWLPAILSALSFTAIVVDRLTR